MKKYFITLSLFCAILLSAQGQTSTDLLSSCPGTTGPDLKFLKDFRVQLGQGTEQGDPRFKANMSLWKNTKYRFTMCNAQDSKGILVLSITDDLNKTVLSSYDPKSGKTYPYVDFTCNKSGIYQLNYDFTKQQQGSGLGVVLLLK